MKHTRTIEAANSALLSRDWASARVYLDQLAGIPAHDYLSHPSAYPGAPDYITDRIDAYNDRVARS